LAPLCDICVRVPTPETFRAQEFHLPIYHCLSLMLEDEFFAPGKNRNTIAGRLQTQDPTG
jgi:D-sedoheptulose 7-phosphate isomerase